MPRSSSSKTKRSIPHALIALRHTAPEKQAYLQGNRSIHGTFFPATPLVRSFLHPVLFIPILGCERKQGQPLPSPLFLPPKSTMITRAEEPNIPPLAIVIEIPPNSVHTHTQHRSLLSLRMKTPKKPTLKFRFTTSTQTTPPPSPPTRPSSPAPAASSPPASP